MSSARRVTFAATALVWALAVAGGVGWGLKLFVPGLTAPPHTRPAPAVSTPPPLAATDLSRLLGADQAPPPMASAAPLVPSDPRYQLLGVVASKGTASPALAVIVVDGKPARAYRVGAVVVGDTVLRAVHAKAADLGPRQGPVRVTLQVPSASAGGVAAQPPVVLPPSVAPAAAPPPAMPTTLPPGRVMPGFVPPARGPNLQPRVPFGVTPPTVAAPSAAPMDTSQAVPPTTDAGTVQNPAADPSQPIRRRNQPADALR